MLPLNHNKQTNKSPPKKELSPKLTMATKWPKEGKGERTSCFSELWREILGSFFFVFSLQFWCNEIKWFNNKKKQQPTQPEQHTTTKRKMAFKREAHTRRKWFTWKSVMTCSENTTVLTKKNRTPNITRKNRDIKKIWLLKTQCNVHRTLNSEQQNPRKKERQKKIKFQQTKLMKTPRKILVFGFFFSKGCACPVKNSEYW